jgi:prepilin-type N-terminal cleavage/methylation domain-containing protein
MSFTQRPIHSRRGFTLLELLIVVSIIAILVVASFAVYAGILKTRKKALAALQVFQIVEAARQYYEAFNVYPPDTGLYEGADQPPQGMSGSQVEWITRYLGREILKRAPAKP